MINIYEFHTHSVLIQSCFVHPASIYRYSFHFTFITHKSFCITYFTQNIYASAFLLQYECERMHTCTKTTWTTRQKKRAIFKTLALNGKTKHSNMATGNLQEKHPQHNYYCYSTYHSIQRCFFLLVYPFLDWYRFTLSYWCYLDVLWRYCPTY